MKITLTGLGSSPIKIPEGQGRFTIGRGKNCDFTTEPGVSGISRTHCTILREGTRGVFIIDNNSTNRTFLNEEKMLSGDKGRKPLEDGDKIRFGGGGGKMPLAEFTVSMTAD